MSIVIRQINPVFVGEVAGIDISRPLTPAEVAEVEAGMNRYAVLVFHDQKVTDEQQIAFSRNFGALEGARGGNITKRRMWDNRQMMHRARRYDERQPRDMRRTTVGGDTPTAAQVDVS
jgi:alpha-ketoglutarate-dependent taurine dioxygenase